MHFHKIQIQGFRGIPELVLENCGKINLLVGKNNTAKTSVLEAIFLLIGASNPILIRNINLFRDIGLIEEEDLRLIFHKMSYDDNIKISGECSNESQTKRSLTIKPSLSNVESSKTVRNGERNKLDDFGVTSRYNKINELTLEFSLKSRGEKSKTHIGIFTIHNNEITALSPKDYREKDKGLYIASNIALSEGNMIKGIENIIINKKQKKVIDVLRKIDKSINDITLGMNGMIYVDVGLEKLMPINLLGDGIRRILRIIVGIAESTNGIVLIDEIDNGLHYTTIGLLWKTLLESAKEFNVQVFATTHSYETLKYLKETLDEVESVAYQKEVKNFTLRKHNDNSIQAYRYDFAQFEYAIEQGIEIR